MSEAAVSGLSCQLNLPLAWTLIQEGGYPPAIEQNNLSRLQIILGLDDASRDLGDDDSDIAAEIQRLDFKINIVLELVAQLVVSGRQRPATVPVTLNPSWVVFGSADDAPSPGARVAIELYLDQRFPFPFVLHGVADSVDKDASGSRCSKVVLEPFSDSVQELFEKYIFRCHRRHVARLKKSAL